MKTQQCAPLKHHYDECAERVQQQEEKDGKAHEDCVEECEWHLYRLKPHYKEQSLISCSLPPHALRHSMRRP